MGMPSQIPASFSGRGHQAAVCRVFFFWRGGVIAGLNCPLPLHTPHIHRVILSWKDMRRWLATDHKKTIRAMSHEELMAGWWRGGRQGDGRSFLFVCFSLRMASKACVENESVTQRTWKRKENQSHGPHGNLALSSLQLRPRSSRWSKEIANMDHDQAALHTNVKCQTSESSNEDKDDDYKLNVQYFLWFWLSDN